MFTIAITGSIGSGKSSALKYFKELGYPTLSSDEVVHDIYASNRDIQEQIEAIVKQPLFDEKGVDRALLSSIIFNRPDLKQRVEEVVHQAVGREIEVWLKLHEQEEFGFVEVPLLFETEGQTHFDLTLMIAIDEKLQIERLIQNRGLTLESIEERLNSQMSQAKKRELADYVIENNNSLLELQDKLDEFLKETKRGCG